MTQPRAYARIISGHCRGLRLALPPASITRPAKENVREAVFNRLSWAQKADGTPLLRGAKVLDVFAGSGSMGLEAASRGAQWVGFVECHGDALGVLKINCAKVAQSGACTAVTKVIAANALKLPKAEQPMDLIFVDPPYHKGLLSPTLASLRNQGWCQESTWISAEIDATEEPDLPEGYTLTDERCYGRVKILTLTVVPISD